MQSIKDVINYRKTCPICDKDLKYEISFSSISLFGILLDSNEEKTNLQEEIIKFNKKKRIIHFSDVPISVKLKKNSFKILDTNPETIKKIIYGLFTIKGACNKEIIGDEYSFVANFYPNTSLDGLGRMKEIEFDLMGFKFKERIVCAVLDEDCVSGYYGSILNDFYSKETIFNLSNIDLKRTSKNSILSNKIPLVEKDFFNFKNKENVISRMRMLMMLKDNNALF